MRQKRCRHEIMYQLLKLAKNGEQKTRLMYGVNLSFVQINEYLKAALDSKFIEQKGKKWVTTSYGKSYMNAFETVISFTQ